MSGSYGVNSWFHSRTSSREEELSKIVLLEEISHLPQFVNVRWSGNPNAPNVIAFAEKINVDSSTMQTKVRQFIRLGFLKEDSNLPLKWTIIAEYWRRMSEGGSKLSRYATTLEQLTMAYALTLYSFNSDTFVRNPTQGFRPLPTLLQAMDANGYISRSNLEALIGDRNSAYWIKDLTRAGILSESFMGFQLTNRFPALMKAIQTVTLPTNMSEEDWNEIRGNALDQRNPYRDAILSDVGAVLEQAIGIESILPHEEQEAITSVVASTDIAEEREIDLGDFKVVDGYGKTKTRRKQSAWSKVVCRDYDYQCCMPECDINGKELVSAAHIKKYSLPEGEIGHRANPQNGLCLCPICHALFDKGYFTLTHDLKIEVSPTISNLKSNIVNNIVQNSDGKVIDPLPSVKHRPSIDFIFYHRKQVFKG